MENKECPVVIGEKFEGECISKGAKGDGIFKKDGFIVIVPKAEVGNTYKIQVILIILYY